MKIIIHQHLLMNQQSISVYPTTSFLNFIKQKTGKSEIHLHASNVYLFQIPPEGETQKLSSAQMKFILKEEFSLYEEPFESPFDYSEKDFHSFFKIEWHGVNYHIDIDNL